MLVALISTTVVLTVGVIPFLGLIIPNIVSLFKGDNLSKTLPHTALLGMSFLLFCDIVGRVLIFPYEIPISMTVGVIGSAIFLIMLFRGKHMRNRTKMLILLGLAVASILLYVFYELNGNYHYAFPRRLIKVVAMSLTGIAIAYSTVVFQTITHNRILTPSVMGLDALYMMVQTFIYFFFGSMSIFVINAKYNFLLAVLAMVVFAVIFYRVLFKEGKRPIYFLLLVGMIVGTFLGSVTTFFQVLIDPNEFLSLQSKMFASFNNVNSDLVWLAGVVITITFIYGWRHMNQLDVMSLGRDTAINLGVPYDKLVQRMLILSSVLIAVSTALVGPITFFGLIVANLSYQFFKTYKHSVIIAGSCVMSIVALVGGQWVVERIFNFDTTLSVIINFVGGVYFIYLLLKESRSAG